MVSYESIFSIINMTPITITLKAAEIYYRLCQNEKAKETLKQIRHGG